MFFGACAQTRKTVRTKERDPLTVKTTTPKINSIFMRRGACFGRCPEYTITIASDGQASYSGFRNANPLGVYQKNIGVKATELFKECTEYRVDTCSTNYYSRMTDVPTLYFVFTIDGKEHKIGNAQFGPLYFINLAADIDRAGIPDDSWKKISDKAGD